MSGEFWNLIRIGEVTAVDHTSARVQVTFEELETTSDPLPVIQRGAGLEDYWMPTIGDMVVCLFYSDGTEEGCCLGSYYPAGSPPSDGAAGVFYTRYPDGCLVKWDNGTLTITAPGGVTIDADLTVGGDLTVNGDATINGVCKAQAFQQI